MTVESLTGAFTAPTPECVKLMILAALVGAPLVALIAKAIASRGVRRGLIVLLCLPVIVPAALIACYTAK